MKIVQLVSTYPPYKGGIGNVAFAIARELKKRNINSEVITPDYSREEGGREGVRYIKPLFKIGNAAFCPGLSRWLKDYDILHLHFPCFGLAEPVLWHLLFHKSKKLILHFHMDTFGRGATSLVFRLHNAVFKKWLLKKADKIIVTSLDYVKHSSIKTLYKKMPEKFAEVANGVDFADFNDNYTSNKITGQYFIQKNDRYGLFVGGMDKAHYFKGIEYLLEAWSLYKKRSGSGSEKLVLVGEGGMREHYQDLAHALGIKNDTVFTGKVDDLELANLYSDCSFLVLPSVDSSEAFGMVLVEAMAMKKPVIASDLPGVRSVVEDKENGYLCPPRSVDCLVDRISRLIKNKELAQKMGQSGYKKATDFYQWKYLADKIVRIYKDLA